MPAGSLDCTFAASWVFFWSFCWTGVSGVPADDDDVVVLDVDALVATLSSGPASSASIPASTLSSWNRDLMLQVSTCASAASLLTSGWATWVWAHGLRRPMCLHGWTVRASW